MCPWTWPTYFITMPTPIPYNSLMNNLRGNEMFWWASLWVPSNHFSLVIFASASAYLMTSSLCIMLVKVTNERVVIDMHIRGLGACFEMTGTVLAVSIYTTWYVGLVHSTDTDCDSQGRRLSDHNLKAAYQWHAATVAVLVVVCGVITVVSIKEQQGVRDFTMQLTTLYVSWWFRGLTLYKSNESA